MSTNAKASRKLCTWLVMLLPVLVESFLVRQPMLAVWGGGATRVHDRIDSDEANNEREAGIDEADAQPMQYFDASEYEELGIRKAWIKRLNEVCEYKVDNGHTFIPQMYSQNPTLGKWVSTQRVSYHKYNRGQHSTMTDAKMELLDQIGFCWNATVMGCFVRPKHVDNPDVVADQLKVKAERYDGVFNSIWWTNLRRLQLYLATRKLSSVHDVPSRSSVGKWLTNQRQEYDIWQYDQDASGLDKDKINALASVDSDWYLRNIEQLWEDRFAELLEYRSEHGDCLVPYQYKNEQLGHWVFTQRQRYKAMINGRSGSTEENERVRRLEEIGFVWSCRDLKPRDG